MSHLRRARGATTTTQHNRTKSTFFTSLHTVHRRQRTNQTPPFRFRLKHLTPNNNNNTKAKRLLLGKPSAVRNWSSFFSARCTYGEMCWAKENAGDVQRDQRREKGTHGRIAYAFASAAATIIFARFDRRSQFFCVWIFCFSLIFWMMNFLFFSCRRCLRFGVWKANGCAKEKCQTWTWCRCKTTDKLKWSTIICAKWAEQRRSGHVHLLKTGPN